MQSILSSGLALASTLYLINYCSAVKTAFVERHNRPNCEANEVCADIWNTFRTRHGVRTPEVRHILNCNCTDGTSCDWRRINSPNGIWQTSSHKEVTCSRIESVCGEEDFPRVRVSPSFSRPYFKINCRCPGETSHTRRRASYDNTILDNYSGMWSEEDQGFVDNYNCNENKVEPRMSRFRNFK